MLVGDFKCSFEANFISLFGPSSFKDFTDVFSALVMSCHPVMMITDQWSLAVAGPNK
jgi:hypothetical protein